MSAELPIPLTVDQAHGAAISEVNRWRGHCIESFARLERGATHTLQLLPADYLRSMPQVFGERLKRLKSAVSPEGVKPHKKIHKALEDMTELLAKRNMMVHAVGSVFIDGKGNWLWRYSFQPSKAGAQEETGTISQIKGQQLEADLSSKVHSLCGQLRSFCEALKKDEAATKSS